MSMTDLKAFGLSWLMGARKLPAAPALVELQYIAANLTLLNHGQCRGAVGREGASDLHHIVDPTQLLYTPLHGSLQALRTAHINTADA